MLNLLLALVIGALAAADQPKAKLRDKEIQDRLCKKITFEGKAEPLLESVGYLCERVDVPFAFDKKAFGYDVQGSLVHPKGGTDVPVATALQQVLDQADATYVMRDGKVVVVPKLKKK